MLFSFSQKYVLHWFCSFRVVLLNLPFVEGVIAMGDTHLHPNSYHIPFGVMPRTYLQPKSDVLIVQPNPNFGTCLFTFSPTQSPAEAFNLLSDSRTDELYSSHLHFPLSVCPLPLVTSLLDLSPVLVSQTTQSSSPISVTKAKADLFQI